MCIRDSFINDKGKYEYNEQLPYAQRDPRLEYTIIPVSYTHLIGFDINYNRWTYLLANGGGLQSACDEAEFYPCLLYTS